MLNSNEGLSERAADAVEVCENEVKRIAKILDSLSQFSKVPKEEPTLNDVNEVVRHVLNLFAPQFREEKIQVQETYESTLPLIFFAKSRIEQVFFSIISNALEAMSGREKRVLTLNTMRLSSGDHVQVIISDTGTGIDIQNMSRIFDPFFTTKNQSEGTGLGLFLSYGIVKDHGGRIWAERNDAGGASFFIDLPVVRRKESNPSRREPPPEGKAAFSQGMVET
jgi:two-component system NtrC family sensor kinase